MQTHPRVQSLNGFPTAISLAKNEIAKRQQRLAELRSKQTMALQVPNMLGHPGFKVFLQEIAKMRDAAMQQLLTGDPELPTMLSQRERALAFDEVLAIVQEHEKMAVTLAEEISAEEQTLQ